MPRAKEKTCCLCFTRCRNPKLRRPANESAIRATVTKIVGRELLPTDVICSGCRFKCFQNKAKKAKKAALKTSVSVSIDDHAESTHTPIFSSPKTIQLHIPSTLKSHKYCVVCKLKSSSRAKLIVVPSEAQTQVFIEKCIFISDSSRCCASHFNGKYFTEDALSSIQPSSESVMLNKTGITSLLQKIRTSLKRSKCKLDFDGDTLTEDDYHNLTGISKSNFLDLAESLQSLMRNTTVRSVRTCLAILLVKLRTGLTNSIISTLFSMDEDQVKRSIHSARKAVMEDFVPRNLGFGHIRHEDFVAEHTTTLAKSLFGRSEDSAIIVLDGTYVYIQKSSDYTFQRQSYSLHKHRPLVKPMVIVGTDGYILSVIGPYLANSNNNDAAITKHMMWSNIEGMNEWLQEEDVCIVDRGFRDAVPFLQSQGFHVEMPSFLNKGSKQHPVNESNSSRMVTKIRWIVESVNGRIKQWRMLDKVVSNHYIPCIGDFVKIVCALCNRYRSPLASSSEKDLEVAGRMKELSLCGNKLLQELERENLLKKRVVYDRTLASAIQCFPHLTEEELRELTLGVYQLKQAISYTTEHLDDKNEYSLQLCNVKDNLLKAEIQSRHQSSKTYSVWIEYNNSADPLASVSEKITGYYCTCKVGARVVGCCTHVTSIVWYLGYQRFSEMKTHKSAVNILDATVVESDDSSDLTSEPEE